MKNLLVNRAVSTAKKNFNLRWLLVPILLIILGVGNVWGDTTVSATFKSSGSYNTTITTAESSIEWTSDKIPNGWVSWTCGSTSNTITLTSTTFSTKYIKNVTISAKRNKAKTITASCTVGREAIGSSQTTAGASGVIYSLAFDDIAGKTGKIVITLTSPGGTTTANKGSLMVTAISVTYADSPAGSTKTLHFPSHKSGHSFLPNLSFLLCQCSSCNFFKCLTVALFFHCILYFILFTIYTHIYAQKTVTPSIVELPFYNTCWLVAN